MLSLGQHQESKKSQEEPKPQRIEDEGVPVFEATVQFEPLQEEQRQKEMQIIKHSPIFRTDDRLTLDGNTTYDQLQPSGIQNQMQSDGELEKISDKNSNRPVKLTKAVYFEDDIDQVFELPNEHEPTFEPIEEPSEEPPEEVQRKQIPKPKPKMNSKPMQVKRTDPIRSSKEQEQKEKFNMIGTPPKKRGKSIQEEDLFEQSESEDEILQKQANNLHEDYLNISDSDEAEVSKPTVKKPIDRPNAIVVSKPKKLKSKSPERSPNVPPIDFPRRHKDPKAPKLPWRNAKVANDAVYVQGITNLTEPSSPKSKKILIPQLKASKTEPELDVIAQEINTRLERILKLSRQQFPASNHQEGLAKLCEKGLIAPLHDEVEAALRGAEAENAHLRLSSEEAKQSRAQDPREVGRLQKAVADAERRIRQMRNFETPSPRFAEPDENRMAKIEFSRVKSLVCQQQSQVEDLEGHIAELNRRVKLMTQKKSSYAATPKKRSKKKARPASDDTDDKPKKEVLGEGIDGNDQ